MGASLQEQVVALVVSKRIQYLMLLLLAASTILIAIYRIPTTGLELDSPLHHYVAWLIAQGYRPYVDVFDMQFPGVYFIHLLNIVLLGPGDIGFKVFDFVWSLGTIAAFFIFLRRISRISAVVGSILLGHWYIFSDGNAMSMQKEWLTLLPLLIAFNIIANPNANRLVVRSIAFGVFLGLASSIRPQFILFTPAAGLVFALYDQDQTLRQRTVVLVKGIILAISGFIIPVGAITLWLWSIGSLAGFIELVTQYLPLYSGLAPPMTLLAEMAAADRPVRVLNGLLLLTGLSFFPLVVLSIFLWVQQARSTMRLHPVFSLGVYLVAFGMVHFAVMGKFFLYHRIPFLTGAFLLMSLMFALPDWESGGLLNLTLTFAILLVVIFSKVNAKAGQEVFDLIRGENTYATRTALVRDVAKYLRENLDEGETIQVLDSSTQGGLHASLQAEARQATRYIFAFHFYHHTDHPFIQFLRHNFIESLDSNRPQFIIDYWQNKNFTVLYDFINNNYTIARKLDEYVIYERQDNQ